LTHRKYQFHIIKFKKHIIKLKKHTIKVQKTHNKVSKHTIKYKKNNKPETLSKLKDSDKCKFKLRVKIRLGSE